MKETASADTGHGYWLYPDGKSIWGMGVYRENMEGVRIDASMHEKPKEEKLKWLAEHQAAKAKEKAEAEAKEKAAARKK